MPLQQKRVVLANGIELDVVDEGPRDAPWIDPILSQIETVAIPLFCQGSAGSQLAGATVPDSLPTSCMSPIISPAHGACIFTSTD